jgi:hypothetical protein
MVDWAAFTLPEKNFLKTLCYFVNFAILVPHAGQAALSIGLPFDVSSFVTWLSSTFTFSLHFTQYID